MAEAIALFGGAGGAFPAWPTAPAPARPARPAGRAAAGAVVSRPDDRARTRADDAPAVAPVADAAAADAALADALADAAVVARTRAGDRDAFGLLVRRHLTAALSAARAVVDDRADAEDVAQDAFLTALERIEDCVPESKFRGWLLVIVRNRALDLRRRQRVRLAEPLDEAGPEGAPPLSATLASGLAGPAQAAERADARAHLRAALATLSETRRAVVLLHDLEGWSHREIGEHLGIAEGTVRAHLFWARRALRQRLSPDWKREADHDDA